MAGIKYSEKETAILNGMISLIKEGANPYRVKVSDIAEAAGVGKGTIYDYFKTKEEVMTKAIFYNIRNEIDLLTERIKSKDGFKEKYYEMLNIIVENLLNKFSTFNMLISAGRLPDFNIEQLHENCEHYVFNHVSIIDDKIDDLLALGVKEGIIKEVDSRYYQRMVIKSSLYVFGNYLTMRNIYKNISMKQAMDYSYKLVIKALN